MPLDSVADHSDEGFVITGWAVRFRDDDILLTIPSEMVGAICRLVDSGVQMAYHRHNPDDGVKLEAAGNRLRAVRRKSRR